MLSENTKNGIRLGFLGFTFCVGMTGFILLPFVFAVKMFFLKDVLIPSVFDNLLVIYGVGLILYFRFGYRCALRDFGSLAKLVMPELMLGDD